MADSWLMKAVRKSGSSSSGDPRANRGSIFSSTDDRDEKEGRYLGVPDDYMAPRPQDFSGQHMSPNAGEAYARAGRGHGSVLPRPPQFFKDDEWRLQPRSTAGRIELQKRMAAAGLLTDSFLMGSWDQPTAEAYATVLAYANQQGVSAEQALALLESSEQVTYDPATGTFVKAGAGSLDQAPVPELVTQITDKKVLRSVFRRAVMDMIGIGWSDEQLDAAAESFNNVERLRQREMYNAQLASGQLGALTAGQDPQAQEVVSIPSPEGYIDEYIREKAPEDVAENNFVNMTDTFMQTAGSTAWGVGQQI